jgi:hypothetical protein
MIQDVGRTFDSPVVPSWLTPVISFRLIVSSMPAIDHMITRLIRNPPARVQDLG